MKENFKNNSDLRKYEDLDSKDDKKYLIARPLFTDKKGQIKFNS